MVWSRLTWVRRCRITVKTLSYIAKQAQLAKVDRRDVQYIASFTVDELSSAAEDQVRDGEYDLDSVTAVRLSDTLGERFFGREF
jgi:hypothetical protein